MKNVKIAVNGFGRIGRKITRLAIEHPEIDIVGINNLGTPETTAHLLKYDSVHGTFPYPIHIEGDSLIIESPHGMRKILLASDRDPAQLPWKKLGAEIIHECTGAFTDRDQAAAHLQAGAKRVIISAPSKNADITLCMGVNSDRYDPTKHTIVSNASCTTNCLAPVVKVLNEKFGIKHGTMLTVHSYTNDQRILDLPHKDLRRARAAAVSIIPTSTGAAKAVALVLPEMKGKLDGLAIRVPTPNVSLVDFTGELNQKVTIKEINQAFIEASQKSSLKGILNTTDAPLVSIDFNGNTSSSTIDLELTNVVDESLVKVVSWYDNESGFSARMIDLTLMMTEKGI